MSAVSTKGSRTVGTVGNSPFVSDLSSTPLPPFVTRRFVHQAVALAELGSKLDHDFDNCLLRKSDAQTFKGHGKAEGVLRGEACVVAFALRQGIMKCQLRGFAPGWPFDAARLLSSSNRCFSCALNRVGTIAQPPPAVWLPGPLRRAFTTNST